MARKKTPVATEAAAEPPPPASPEPSSPVVTLGRKDLIERVREASGARKKDVKAIVEATLALMGEALSRGEVLHLPPLGVARVKRGLDGNDGKSLVVKLRRSKGDPKSLAAKEALAEADEAD
jgi:hypothetical protein